MIYPFVVTAHRFSPQWRNDGVAAASSDGGPTGGRGPPAVLDFLVINFSGYISVNIFSIRFVVLLASDRVARSRVARSSKFLLISASYWLF